MKRGIFTSCLLLLVPLFFFTACNWDPVGISEPWQSTVEKEPCNGDPSLCDKAYNEVVYPTTHNSYNYDLGPTQFFQPNQQYPVRRQLLDGVRGLMLDISEYQNDIVVMHRNPDIIALLTEDIYAALLGYESASSPLGQIKTFLDENPREVVSIIVESDLPGTTIEDEFNSAGLVDYIYTPTGTTWPTLEEMIDSNRRLVVYTENSAAAGNPAWLLYAWDNIHDTDFSVSDSDDFNCNLNRGSTNNDLYLMNHWIVPLLGGGDPNGAAEVNDFDFLMSRTLDCWQATGVKPNFVAVDLYRTGDLFAVCDSLNALETP